MGVRGEADGTEAGGSAGPVPGGGSLDAAVRGHGGQGSWRGCQSTGRSSPGARAQRRTQRPPAMVSVTPSSAPGTDMTRHSAGSEGRTPSPSAEGRRERPLQRSLNEAAGAE